MIRWHVDVEVGKYHPAFDDIVEQIQILHQVCINAQVEFTLTEQHDAGPLTMGGQVVE